MNYIALRKVGQTEAMIRKGGKYNWKGQAERLVYLGLCEPRNGRWHQFAKVESPGLVWCEVLAKDLHLLELTEEHASVRCK